MGSIDKQIFYINSEQRMSGETATDFHVKLDFDPSHKFNRVAVLACNIPYSYYLIRSGVNDTFTLTEDGVSANITITSANYSSSKFITEVLLQLNTNSPHGWVYDMTIDVSNAKFTWTVTGNGGIQPIFTIGRHVGDHLGFDYDSSNLFSGNSLTSTNVINFVSTNSLFLHSKALVDDKSSVLQEMYVANIVPFQYIPWSNPNWEMYSKRLKNSRQSNVFDFSLTDDEGVVIDTNGLSIYITLAFYKKDNLTDLVERFMRYFFKKEIET